MSEKTKMTRILIVEDSIVCRELLVSIFHNAPGLQVIGTARDGAEGVRLVKRLKPDLVTMDIHMPEMDGYEATRRIMAEVPCPIVMISGSLAKNEHELTFDALQAGALSIINKPTINDSKEVHQQLIDKINLMSEIKVIRRWGKERQKSTPIMLPALPSKNWQTQIQMIAIAASTGGPGALANVLAPLPANFPIPIVIVQHVTIGFCEGFSSWLDSQVSLKVRVARQADNPQPGEVLVAPDDYHMTINSMGLVSLNKQAPYHGLRPAANALFHSVAQVYGKTAVGIILTGMGDDGAEGLKSMHDVGAHIIAQDENSCVVFGMPAAAVALGSVDQIKPLAQIAPTLIKIIQG